MKHSTVPNHNVVADRKWPAFWVVLASVGRMQHGVVLHVATMPQLDRVHVASQDGPRPDRFQPVLPILSNLPCALRRIGAIITA